MQHENYYEKLWRKQLAAKYCSDESTVAREHRILIRLWEQWYHMRITWSQLAALLKVEPDTELLWSVLPRFLDIISESMWRDLIVSHSSMIDDGKSVVSLKRWWRAFGSIAPKDCQISAKVHIDQYELAVKGIQKVRHEHVAHINAKRAVNRNELKVEFDEMENALVALDYAMNAVLSNYDLTVIGWEMEPPGGGDVSTLVDWIKHGNAN